jgi:DEAD/DEAH box helicase domain-containing protein
MIPSVLAQHVEQGVKDFLRTTFPVTTPFFSNMLDRFLNEPGNVFKGPYLDIQLPFQLDKGGSDYFPNLPMQFPPYLHQIKSFDRLSGPNPKSTIISTGTGSGKTECFLYPILDYCYQHRGESGIKAILIYPMNALATDQAGRLAKLIYKNSKLRGHVSAGIYVGQREKNPSMVMKADSLISDKETLRLTPPDILLTNYKMLDYLLIRLDDRPLWQNNTSETLRFLVVDELHNFDGAQASDLGCLIRRLKSRLATPPEHLCCVGTSATLGSDEEQADLLKYASSVFGETLSEDAVISELRLSAGEFLGDSLISYIDIVPQEKSPELDPANFNRYEEYIQAQHKLWFGEDIHDEFGNPEWRIELGDKIKKHLFFQNLLKVLGGKIYSFDNIFLKLENITKGLKSKDTAYKVNMLNSLLALVSEARIKMISKNDDGSEEENISPFLNVRLHVWLRELRRMVGEVVKDPQLRFADDLNKGQLNTHLPLVHCRECGSMGWSGLKHKNSTAIVGELQSFYHSFFNHDPKVVYLFPEEEDVRDQSQNVGMAYLCPNCLNVTTKPNPDQCPSCAHPELILVYMPDVRRKRGNRQESINDCPYCGAQNSLTLLGSRTASLTSVMIVQLYSSTYNDDKKLLTFSDNVQDAAHRAGFFNSRTFRFNFRTALQKVVLTTGDGLTLAQLPYAFIEYWLKQFDDNKYISIFLAPNMDWLKDYEYLKRHGSLPQGSTLQKDVNRRIGWEIISEYGYQARIGRTLEKTGSSVAYFDQEILKRSVKRLLEPIRNEIGGFRGLEEASLTRFLLGLIIHIKNQGGIFQPILKPYIDSFGNTYVLNNTIWMPNFGPYTRAPAFLTTRRGTRFDQLYSASPTRRTWYLAWAEKCFLDLTPMVLSISKPLYDLVLKGLVDEKVLEENKVRGDVVWGICPEVLRISARVRQFRCDRCGHNISVAEEESPFFEDAPCQRFHCYGKYRPQETGVNYYGRLYAAGDVERIFAREHTGLLKRDDRQELEEQFKAEPGEKEPWFPNLLSCTPTLELGIDIGNLSSLVLCSVPPAQANYLQRIGRSGRRDGNALNLTVANARPHDLYFFAEPEEMLAGYVDSPGIFLDASAVLERQFTAFCFDRWVATVNIAAIPKKLGQVLNSLEPVDHKKFPHNFIHYIETNQADLFNLFVALFTRNVGLSLESIKNLKIFIEGGRDWQGSLRYRIMNGLHSRRKERDSLRKKVQILNGKINKKKKDPKDKNFEKDLRELGIEKSALQALLKSISDRDTYNFFTDEGLLPNYAFPEVGVMLKSIIYRKKLQVQDGESRYDSWNYEYERPAVSAIEELAPANSFYASGRRVKVDQVDMSVSEVETWRFCNNCSHKELLGKEEEKEICPMCGTPMWADEGQKRQMLKMRQVFASTPDRRSRISDDSDDRDPTFYNKQMLIEFDDNQIMDAYKVDADYPFGFDFLSKVDFCEINFGEKTEIGEKVSIAGVEMPRRGFKICRVCGKIQEDNKHPSHAFTCTARDQESDKDLIDCIYLYRQFTSEAIRILLPVSIIVESDKKLHSFIAAMQLGLKRKFKGKIDHLQTTVHEEPLADSSFKRKYLVLYDTVPGGTGYLKQLMRSKDQLMEVLELSLDALRSCPCNQEADKDGCYKCLFAYRNSYSMPETSRDTAIELLAEILGYRDKLVQTDTIKNISLNTLIESELEAKFIGALKRYRSEELAVSLTNDLVNGKPGYFLKLGERAYYIEPQVNIGELDGVSVPSRTDFVIRTARLNDAMKPVAVFLDGYTYHRDRVGEDMAQRMAIVQSGKFHVWSLSWSDVENIFKPQKDFYIDYLVSSGLPAGNNFDKLLTGYGLSDLKGRNRLNSFELLIRFLQNPEEDRWRLLTFVFSLLHVDAVRFKRQEAIEKWTTDLETNMPKEMAEKIKNADCPCLYGLLESKNHEDKIGLQQFVVTEQTAVTPPGNAVGVRVGCCLYDDESSRQKSEFQAIWNGFLRLYNLFQFLPLAFFVTTEGINKNAYDGIKLFDETIPAGGEPLGEPEKESWDEVREMTDEKLYGLLDALRNSGWLVPETGYELVDLDGKIIASAELAWEELKIAFLLDEELEYGSQFVEAGWHIYPMKDVLENPDDYMSMNKK